LYYFIWFFAAAREAGLPLTLRATIIEIYTACALTQRSRPSDQNGLRKIERLNFHLKSRRRWAKGFPFVPNLNDKGQLLPSSRYLCFILKSPSSEFGVFIALSATTNTQLTELSFPSHYWIWNKERQGAGLNYFYCLVPSTQSKTVLSAGGQARPLHALWLDELMACCDDLFE
jgi:hypothetical protein